MAIDGHESCWSITACTEGMSAAQRETRISRCIRSNGPRSDNRGYLSRNRPILNLSEGFNGSTVDNRGYSVLLKGFYKNWACVSSYFYRMSRRRKSMIDFR